MFDTITLGQYYQTDSLLHRLDPRVKLVGTFVYLISLFVVDSFVGYIAAALFLAAMIMLSNVPFRYIVRGMKTIVFLLLITVVFNLFLTPGEVIWHAGIFKITREGLTFAIKMAVRLSLSGEPPETSEEGSCTGPRDRHDDVHCASLYTDPHGRDRQNHEGADCQGSGFRE